MNRNAGIYPGAIEQAETAVQEKKTPSRSGKETSIKAPAY